MEMTDLWNTAPCSLVVVDRRFRGAYCLHHQGGDRPDGLGSTHLSNVDLLQRRFTAQYPRRLSSSYSQPWEPEISRGDESLNWVVTTRVFSVRDMRCIRLWVRILAFLVWHRVVSTQKIEVKVKTYLVLNWAPRNTDVCGSRGMAPRVLNLSSGGGDWLASRYSRFTPEEITPVPIG
jgi:hypothetical protein